MLRHTQRRALRFTTAAAVTVAAASVLTSTAASAATTVSRAPVVAFQPAGEVGGGVLQPGTLYPPTTHGSATLQRGSDWIQAEIQTSGLPAGAYTVWWVIFDTPTGCVNGCDDEDLLNRDANASVFRATGGVVRDGTATSFRARYRVGDPLGEPDTQHVLGDGALEPTRAEVINVIKYHGPAADNPATLHEQTHTLLGSCTENANAIDLGEPFGVQCFDPQAVAYPLP